jgi:hypothetical protein
MTKLEQAVERLEEDAATTNPNYPYVVIGWAGREDLRLVLAALQRYEEALEFYGVEKNYRTTSTGFAIQYDPVMPVVHADMGAKARAALEQD